ncbi:hypothetical protein SAMN04488523_10111 [Sulfitobacter brevis]|uniref:Uncharacterized protein n=1 Tax=Sulfitobacter brevis TaxID=74348 RepID=A0A1I1SF09_9RHOB|nr:hypothetical protein SAMN04488523_10111 [Sulfitobacter brevis]
MPTTYITGAEKIFLVPLNGMKYERSELSHQLVASCLFNNFAFFANELAK